jgi:ribonuclease P protein component
LEKADRLTKPAQFAAVHANGRSWVHPLLVLRLLPNGLETSRLGFSVSGHVANAVGRNRIKRRLRELLRGVPLRPGFDIVIIARKPSVQADFGQLRQAVENLVFRANLAVKDETVRPGPD